MHREGMDTNLLNGRLDLARRVDEAWRPPLLAPPAGKARRAAAFARRFLDLQAGSIWRDLSVVLPECSGTVLDVGCGAQPYRVLLGAGSAYVGIDTADATAHFGYQTPDTLYFSGSLWPVGDASADVVLCTETLEHVLDTRQFLSEMARVLRPGGRVVLTVPFAARWHFVPHDYWRFTPSSLQSLLIEAGFKDVAVYPRGNALTVAAYKSMALILALLFSTGGGVVSKALRRAAGVVLTPILLVLAIIANISLRCEGGDDCLGYTVLAWRTT